MFEDAVSSSIPSIWASMNSWFTPTVLFVLLNVMIGTIAFTSTLANQKHHHQNPNPNHRQNDHLHHPPAPAPQQPNIVRSPSVLQRLRSINFYNYRSQEPLVSSHFKPISPDSSPSDPQYHQVQLHYQTAAQPPESGGFESTRSQYIFEQAAEAVHQEEKQHVAGGFYESTEGIAGNNGVDNTNNYYRHEEIYQGKPSLEETQSPQYFFQQINEVKHQEDHFQQVSEQENSTHFDFDQSKEEKIDVNDYHHYDSSEKTHEENDDELQSLDEVYSKLSSERHVSRSNSDTKPSAGEIPSKLSKKMKKSASMKSSFNHFDEEDIVEARRPATVKETTSSNKGSVAEADEEVDAKADDFINRFKQQLKLQRLDSILRYKEMIGRASGR